MPYSASWLSSVFLLLLLRFTMETGATIDWNKGDDYKLKSASKEVRMLAKVLDAEERERIHLGEDGDNEQGAENKLFAFGVYLMTLASGEFQYFKPGEVVIMEKTPMTASALPADEQQQPAGEVWYARYRRETDAGDTHLVEGSTSRLIRGFLKWLKVLKAHAASPMPSVEEEEGEAGTEPPPSASAKAASGKSPMKLLASSLGSKATKKGEHFPVNVKFLVGITASEYQVLRTLVKDWGFEFDDYANVHTGRPLDYLEEWSQKKKKKVTKVLLIKGAIEALDKKVEKKKKERGESSHVGSRGPSEEEMKEVMNEYLGLDELIEGGMGEGGSLVDSEHIFLSKQL